MLICLSLLLVISTLPFSGGMESGIVGGKEAKPHSRPYMVSVQCQNEHCWCGGMLVKENYVLTSAHCADDIKCTGKNQMDVILGAHNISQKEKTQQRIQVKECIKHPSYKAGEYLNDVMLLKLKTKAKLTKNVKIISLPKKNETIPAHQSCTVAGWGLKAPNGDVSNVLKEVWLKLQFSVKCQKKWRQYFDAQQMMCTMSDGKRAFCQGDSGGPLICNNKLLGMAAYTFGNCKSSKYEEVYMKIAYFFPWINSVIG